MKILKITSSGFKEGGVENHIAELVPVLIERGHSVRILSSNARPELPHFSDYEYKKPPGGFGKLLYSFNFNSYWMLKKILEEYNPDIVHIHTVGHASPSIFFALKNQKVILTIHGPEGYTKNLMMYCLPSTDFNNGEYDKKNLLITGKLRYFYYRSINFYIYRLGLRRVDAFITMSHYMKDLMGKEGIKSVYIPNGTKLFDYRPFEKKDIPNVILFAGRLEKYKGVDQLIKAMPIILSAIPKAMLFVAGEGSLRRELEKLSLDLKINNSVIFWGQADRDEMQKLYEKSAVTIVPSTWPEAFGLIGIESMSVGRPVIAADVGGISDWLLEGKTGFLVPPRDPAAIAHAAIRLFNDKDMYLRMMRNGRKKAEEFDLSKHVDNLEKIYENLVQK